MCCDDGSAIAKEKQNKMAGCEIIVATGYNNKQNNIIVAFSSRNAA